MQKQKQTAVWYKSIIGAYSENTVWIHFEKNFLGSPRPYSNKISVSELQKLAEIDLIDGVSIYALKIITKKSDCGTLIWKRWQTNLFGSKTAIPSESCFWMAISIDSYVLIQFWYLPKYLSLLVYLPRCILFEASSISKLIQNAFIDVFKNRRTKSLKMPISVYF